MRASAKVETEGDKSILWELQKCGLKAPSYKGGDMHDDS